MSHWDAGPGPARILDILWTADAWLEQLVTGQYLDHDSKVNLCKTCSKLLQFRVQALHVPVLETGLYSAVQMLEEATQRSRARLTLWPGDDMADDLKASFQDVHKKETVCRLQLMTGVSWQFLKAIKEEAMHYVTTLELQYAWLETILPPAIEQSCPALLKLVLSTCAIKWGDPASLITKGGFQKLQSLEIKDLNFYGYSPGYDSAQAEIAAQQGLQCVKAQLRGLRALQSLTVCAWNRGLVGDEILQRDAYEIINAVASQLTHLRVDTNSSYIEQAWGASWGQLCSVMQVLKHLHMPHLIACDEHLELLLQLPAVTHVEMEFILSKSFTKRPCKWEVLMISEVNIKTLARLPLHAGLLFEIGDSTIEATLYLASPSLLMMTQAMVNMNQCKGVVWGKDLSLIVGNHDEVIEADRDDTLSGTLLIGVLKLLHTVTNLRFHGLALTQDVLEALVRFVQSRPEDIVRLHFGKGCVWAAAQMVSLVANMPYKGTLGVCVDADNSQAVITQLCYAAQRSLMMHVTCQAHLETRRIKAAMQACGHQHVTVITIIE